MGELISRHLGHIWIDLLPYEEAIEIAPGPIPSILPKRFFRIFIAKLKNSKLNSKIFVLPVKTICSYFLICDRESQHAFPALFCLKRFFVLSNNLGSALGRPLQDILTFYGRGNKDYEEYYKITGPKQL